VSDPSTHLSSYSRQWIDESDLEAVRQALQSPSLTGGALVAQFENALKDEVGSMHCVVVSNATAALHLGFLSASLGPDDVIIVPTVTFLSTANTVAMCGAKVIFADVDPRTGLMTFETYLAAFKRLQTYPRCRFAGVIMVHLAGRLGEREAISSHAKSNGGLFAEDAAHALGTGDQSGPVGSHLETDFTVFSFHPVKAITTGEGGALTTQCVKRAELVRSLRSHGIERDHTKFTTLRPEPWSYEMVALGYNYRLPDINCALGLNQLRRFSEFKTRRLELIDVYDQRLSSVTGLDWVRPPNDQTTSYHLFSLLIDWDHFGVSRSRTMIALKEKGIGSQVHYIPVHTQPYWQAHQIAPEELMGAMSYYEKALSLPMHPLLTPADVDYVCDQLLTILGIKS
jgi:dTDP-4-amino-4,6-dideoxygalactose transaminase